METIHQHYARFLELGFLVLRQAIDARDWEWANAERELLHNVPSLLDEPNVERHRYFWVHERQHYLDWINRRGGEPRSRMLTYYAPLWTEMEPAMQELLSTPSCASKS